MHEICLYLIHSYLRLGLDLLLFLECFLVAGAFLHLWKGQTLASVNPNKYILLPKVKPGIAEKSETLPS